MNLPIVPMLAAQDLDTAVLNTVVIGLVSMTLLFFSVWLMDRLAPFSVRKEIEEDHNVSAAILCGAVVLGIALVISAVAAG